MLTLTNKTLKSGRLQQHGRRQNFVQIFQYGSNNFIGISSFESTSSLVTVFENQSCEVFTSFLISFIFGILLFQQLQCPKLLKQTTRISCDAHWLTSFSTNFSLIRSSNSNTRVLVKMSGVRIPLIRSNTSMARIHERCLTRLRRWIAWAFSIRQPDSSINCSAVFLKLKDEVIQYRAHFKPNELRYWPMMRMVLRWVSSRYSGDWATHFLLATKFAAVLFLERLLHLSSGKSPFEVDAFTAMYSPSLNNNTNVDGMHFKITVKDHPWGLLGRLGHRCWLWLRFHHSTLTLWYGLQLIAECWCVTVRLIH